MAARKTEVLLFGLGAIGGFYAFILGRNENVSLSVVARSNYGSVKASGLRIESENHGNHQVKIDHVYRYPSEATRKFDYIVCANKAIDPGSEAALFKDIVSEQTTFVLMQNGVGNEDPYRDAFPSCTIISGVVWVGGVQGPPGIVKHTKNEDTQVGLFPNPKLDPSIEKHRLDAFTALLLNGGTRVDVEDNIQVQRWEKVVWNCAWNAITTLTQIDTRIWLDSSSEANITTRRLMQEVVTVAKDSGVPIGDDLIDRLFHKILNMDGVYSSMYVDSKEGRAMEVEVILGTPLKKAKELGIDVPVLSALYSMIYAIDARLRRARDQ